MKKIAIIGGGYTGLSCAKKLAENGFEVTIYEKTNEMGGMAKCIECGNTKLEKHYRHIFKSDKYVMELLKEFNLQDKCKWNETQMAYYDKDKGLYWFGTPLSLLKYKPLTFIQKIFFGISIVKIKLIKDYKSLEKYTAEEWIKKNCGNKVYKKIWEPLLITKFGDKKSTVSMAWLWGKINLRSSSTTSRGERLGYIEGSFDVLTQSLVNHLKKNNVNFKLNSGVAKVFKQDNKYVVKDSNGNVDNFDYIVSTVSYDISSCILSSLLTDDEKTKMQNLEYTYAKTLLIYLNKSLSPFYWINIGDTTMPFGGVIEHTNMMGTTMYDGMHIVYISNYIDKKDKLYTMTETELFDEYFEHLKKINKDLKKQDVIKLQCFEEATAQPIITPNYSLKKLNIQLEEKGIYMANMAQIYPEDRGMNYAIKMGIEVAEKILMDSL